jgi:hypothetical protein
MDLALQILAWRVKLVDLRQKYCSGIVLLVLHGFLVWKFTIVNRVSAEHFLIAASNESEPPASYGRSDQFARPEIARFRQIHSDPLVHQSNLLSAPPHFSSLLSRVSPVTKYSFNSVVSGVSQNRNYAHHHGHGNRCYKGWTTRKTAAEFSGMFGIGDFG